MNTIHKYRGKSAKIHVSQSKWYHSQIDQKHVHVWLPQIWIWECQKQIEAYADVKQERCYQYDQ